jgi:hypothetical protein
MGGSSLARIDNVHTVYADDFNYQDVQIRKIQDWLGISGQFIGDTATATEGPGGVVSPIASGGIAFTVAARDPFSAGKLFSVGDDNDSSYVEKFNIDSDGKLWAPGGADLSGGELNPPSGGTLPTSGMSIGDIFYKTGTSEGLYTYSSTGWGMSGGGIGAGSYLEMGVNHQYSQPVTPVDEVMGQGIFDGSLAGPGTVYFRASLTNVLSVAGTTSIKLFELGPRAGPPGTPRLVTTMASSTNGGPQVLDQVLTISASPASNQIHDSSRMYEVTITQTSASGDSAYTGTVGLEIT